MPLTKNKGFTLIELLVVIAILGMLVAVSAVSFASSSRKQALSATAAAVASALRDARSRTLASVGGDQYGVKVDADRYTFFRGSAFSSSTPGNETFNFSAYIKASSSPATFIFKRVTGAAVSSGSIEIYLSGDETTKKTIQVESTGLSNIQ